MGVAVKFPEQNDIIRGGHTGAKDLAVYADGGQIISCWELTPEELLEIAMTGRVWLVVGGTQQPPVAVTGSYPFIKTQN